MDYVVVGHGLSPVNKGWGSLIDRAGVVVRMWNWHWQQSYPGDYGEKYSYGFYEINATEMSRFNSHNKRSPARGWVATALHSNVGKKRYLGNLPFPTQVVDSGDWEAEGRALGGMGLKGRLVLSRGVRAACWCMTDRMEPGDRLILVGFDNARVGAALPIDAGFPAAYVADPATFPFRTYTGGTTKYSNHDYAVEGRVLGSIATLNRLDMRYAEDLWK